MLHEAARLQSIQRARQAVLAEQRSPTDGMVAAGTGPRWIEQSWRRCLAMGQRPAQRVAFDVLPEQARRRTEDANHALLQAARPVMSRLARAIAGTRYFAILTDAHGTVVGVDGLIDRSDRRASLITRVGVDLSERAVGTTAIGAALAERHPVWLHRGEHFFDDTSCYSCAGAPLFGPEGGSVGMLDLTGIDAAERPELKHLVQQAAHGIEDALLLARPHALLLRLNWPGCDFGSDHQGLVAVDRDGWIVGSNGAAREMLAAPALQPRVHCSEVLACAWESLFDAADQERAIEVPLWSGLTVQVLAQGAGAELRAAPAAVGQKLPLKDLETELIRQAVRDAKGNVAKAAQQLGISRATVYRKLGQRNTR
ncbi:helix-turn-helix domain-containing protein [Ramlibacter algicola]|uniref:Histidine kinase n=1 Tax=Ramlibacter algicola TaxID=2795217 RepID=A0A934Q0F4_9BURK|nr:helix-turn-helix domain-containing protein [Ramlibacter algicola]MBK0392007.1 histidine kinase [Ramlibacter algicola]